MQTRFKRFIYVESIIVMIKKIIYKLLFTNMVHFCQNKKDIYKELFISSLIIVNSGIYIFYIILHFLAKKWYKYFNVLIKFLLIYLIIIYFVNIFKNSEVNFLPDTDLINFWSRMATMFCGYRLIIQSWTRSKTFGLWWKTG